MTLFSIVYITTSCKFGDKFSEIFAADRTIRETIVDTNPFLKVMCRTVNENWFNLFFPCTRMISLKIIHKYLQLNLMNML